MTLSKDALARSVEYEKKVGGWELERFRKMMWSMEQWDMVSMPGMHTVSTSTAGPPFRRGIKRCILSSGNKSRVGPRKRMRAGLPITTRPLRPRMRQEKSSDRNFHPARAQAYARVDLPVVESPQSSTPRPWRWRQAAWSG